MHSLFEETILINCQQVGDTTLIIFNSKLLFVKIIRILFNFEQQAICLLGVKIN